MNTRRTVHDWNQNGDCRRGRSLRPVARPLALAIAVGVLAALHGLAATLALDYPAGFSLFGNPLSHGGNTVAEIFSGSPTPEGTVLYKYDNAAALYSPPNVYDSLFGGWDNPLMTLEPGEGAQLLLPSAATLTFSGVTLSGSSSAFFFPSGVPPSWNLLSSRSGTQGASFESIIGRAPLDGEVVRRAIPGSASPTGPYLPDYVYHSSSGGWSPSAPGLDIGESAWFGLTAAVPEPAACGLVVGWGLALLSVCRRVRRAADPLTDFP